MRKGQLNACNKYLHLRLLKTEANNLPTQKSGFLFSSFFRKTNPKRYTINVRSFQRKAHKQNCIGCKNTAVWEGLVMTSPVWHNNTSKLSTENIVRGVLKYFPCAWTICALAVYCLITFPQNNPDRKLFVTKTAIYYPSFYSAQNCGTQFGPAVTKKKASISVTRSGYPRGVTVCSPPTKKSTGRDLPTPALHSDQGREANPIRFRFCSSSALLALCAAQDNKEGREHHSLIKMAKTQTDAQGSTFSSVSRSILPVSLFFLPKN